MSYILCLSTVHLDLLCALPCHISLSRTMFQSCLRSPLVCISVQCSVRTLKPEKICHRELTKETQNHWVHSVSMLGFVGPAWAL